MEKWHKNHLKNFISIDKFTIKKINLRKLQVGPVKPVAHKHSAMVNATCLQVPPFKHVFVEQTEAKYFSYNSQNKNYLFFLLHSQRAPAKPVGQIH